MHCALLNTISLTACEVWLFVFRVGGVGWVGVGGGGGGGEVEIRQEVGR